ncbi:hypothetical protein [Nocardia miyunensis]|uniref:hypothetical protein n=1 Tax=Nocardia miyunensis TaxID=282684 RepID=UPI000A84BD95|nr:hypothetical protein [Nocardia miyunensis]
MPELAHDKPGYHKPVAVPDDLHLLTGPTSGIVNLPTHLDWSGHAEYDLDRPGRIVDLYRTVINEAASPTDLYTYLDEAVLKRLWSYIWLPLQIKRAWESRFPELAQLSRLASA